MPTVGEILRSEREKKGLSIKDIEKATSIRALYLTAIEDDNYGVIPGEVYLKGFIRNYANHLGLDAKELLNLYRQVKVPVDSVKANDEHIEPTNGQTNQPLQQTKICCKGKTKKLILAGLAGVVIIGSVWWMLGNRVNQPPKQTKPAPTVPTLPSQPMTPSAPVPQQPISQNKPIVIIAKYTDACWTLVIADGKEIYEGIPRVGETLTWDAQSNLTVQLGNASGVEMTYNGQSLGQMGRKGEVLKKTFTAATKQ